MLKKEIILQRIFVIAFCLLISGCQATTMDSLSQEHKTTNRVKPKNTVYTLPLKCIIEEGTAHFTQGWYDFKPGSFKIVKGQIVQTALWDKKNKSRVVIQVEFKKGGQKVVFCPVSTVREGEVTECSSMYLLEDDLYQGVKRSLDIPTIIRGGQIECSYGRSFVPDGG